MGFQKLNRKGALKNAFFSLVVVSMAVIAVGIIFSNYSDKYGSGLTYDLEEYQDLKGASSEAQNQRGKVTPTDPDPGTGDFEGKIFRGGYGILGGIFAPFGTFFNMLESLEHRFGLPSYVMEGILALIFFSLIASVITVIFRLTRSP